MEVKPKTLVDYETEDGTLPLRDWLTTLDHLIRARIEARLNRIALGNIGDAKPVGEGVSELRFHFGKGYRIYFAQHGNEIIVLLCAGDKSSQKSDIELAKEYWLNFKRRNYA